MEYISAKKNDGPGQSKGLRMFFRMYNYFVISGLTHHHWLETSKTFISRMINVLMQKSSSDFWCRFSFKCVSVESMAARAIKLRH